MIQSRGVVIVELANVSVRIQWGRGDDEQAVWINTRTGNFAIDRRAAYELKAALDALLPAADSLGGGLLLP